MSQNACKRCGARLDAGIALQGMCTKCLMELGMDEDSHVVITGASEAPAPPPSPEELAPLFPRHEILELLGQGGMGVVYKARQKGLDREVALKILPASTGRDPAFAERFAQEARALASLSHANITQVFDFGKAGEHFYLAMEFVDGLNLRQLIASKSMSPKQALQIVEQICDALQYAHDEGVVHRDIKPENILLDRKGRLKITDFGLAKLLGREGGVSSLTLTHQVMGTPHYMAPEQVEQPSTVDHRADIFSLGVVFYELLTGELPLGRFSPPSRKVQVSVELDEVVLKALEKEPNLRYQTAGAIKTDVHDLGDPGRGASKPRRLEPRAAAAGGSARKDGRRWLPSSTLGCVLLGLFLLVAIPAAGSVLLFLFLGTASMEGSFDDPDDSSPFSYEIFGPEPQPVDIPATRLEGLALLEIEGGKPLLSAPFRRVFELDEGQVADAEAALLGPWREYQDLLDEHTTYRTPEPGFGHVTVAEFPADHARLSEGLERSLGALLPPPAAALLRERQALTTELFRYGRTSVVHEIWKVEDGYEVSRADADGASGPMRVAELSEELARHWWFMYQTLGQGAAIPTLRALEALDGFEAQEGTVMLRYVTTKTRLDGVEIDLTLRCLAEDPEVASRLLHDLTRYLSEQPGMRATTDSTQLIHEGGGVEARITLEIAGQALLSSVQEPLWDEVEVADFLRQVARDAGVGEVNLNPRNLRANNGPTRDLDYRVQSAASDSYPLASVVQWLEGLAAVRDRGVVTSVNLSRERGTTPEEDEWRCYLNFAARVAD